MKVKEEEKIKEPKIQKLRQQQQEKITITDSKAKVNHQADNKQFNVQLIILEEVKKLKVNLEVTDKNKSKSIYSTSVTLNELKNLNKFFSQFKDYSEAFDYLLKNFTKIDRTKVSFLNNNKDIKISLLFSLNDISQKNNSDIIEDNIELTLHNYSINSNKTLANLNSVVNNLKSGFDKFNSMLKELKASLNNEKVERNEKINELENALNSKFNEKNDKIIQELKTKIESIEKQGVSPSQNGMEDKTNGIDTGTGPDLIDEKLFDVYSKMEVYDNELDSIKKNIEEGFIKHKNEINKNNKIFLEKENELSELITDKFQEFFEKINSLDENMKNIEDKNGEIENYVNDKMIEIDNKTNICFNELIKKINKKSYNLNISEDDIKLRFNGIIHKIVEDNLYSEKNFQTIINEKMNEFKKGFNEQINERLKAFEEKLLDLTNKINDKKIDKDNNDNIFEEKLKELEEKMNNFEKVINNLKNENNKDINNNIEYKINDFNDFFTKKFEEIEQFKININDNLTKAESKINEHKLKLNDIDTQILEICEEINKAKSEEKKDEAINNNEPEINSLKEEIKDINSDLKNNINPKLNELTDKINETNLQIINIIETKVKSLQKKLDTNSKTNSSDKLKEINQKNNNQIIDEINTIKEESNKNLNETKNNIDNKSKEINSKIYEAKKELYTMINKINDHIKEDNKDINNKIFSLRNDLLKTIDNKNALIENKIKSNEGKLISFENKINKITKDNQSYLDKINTIEKGNKSNIDINKSFDNKLKDLDTYIKSVDLKLNFLDNKIKQMDNRVEIKKSKEYSSKTLVSSNSNGKIVPNPKISFYRSIVPKNVGLNINSDDTDDELKTQKNTSFINKQKSRINLSKEKSSIFELSINSKILKKEDINENFFLFKKLKGIYPYNRYIKLVLQYRATRDGDLSKDFHRICDLIGPNITLIKTKKGYIFGGFTIKMWKHNFKDIKKDDYDYGTEIKDSQAFGFSVNKKKIYENGKPNENIIYCNKNYGPCFKNYFFKVFNECLKNGGVCGRIGESNFIGIDKQYEFNGGEEKFDIEEIEVFQIGFR